MQSDQMMSALLSAVFKNLFSSIGNNHGGFNAKAQLNDAEPNFDTILKNLFGHLVSANNEANVQTGLANNVDYKGAPIEAINSLSTEDETGYLQNLLDFFSG